ncbi:hypothetical protein BYT27DRAFT_7105414 [Phlegmacium glaucopus]|nr:hypothetical protein BYT27DRAFT_7105414 [Phlegmacium glaucopus]
MNAKVKIDIFFLELVAILSAIHHIAIFPSPPRKVLLWTDILLALAGILLETGIDLCIRHIAGKENIQADLLSRLMVDEFYRRFPSKSVCLFSPPRELLLVRWRECF